MIERRADDEQLAAMAREQEHELREFLFGAVYENATATAEFRKATDVLTGLWEKVRQRADEFLDVRTIEEEGLDTAACDFVAGMTDRYAVRLFEQLFVPTPWAEM